MLLRDHHLLQLMERDFAKLWLSTCGKLHSPTHQKLDKALVQDKLGLTGSSDGEVKDHQLFKGVMAKYRNFTNGKILSFIIS